MVIARAARFSAAHRHKCACACRASLGQQMLLIACLLGLRWCCPVLQMDQFFFMADRHDPSFCAVRYMTDVRLREWKVYLQPVAKRELLQCVELIIILHLSVLSRLQTVCSGAGSSPVCARAGWSSYYQSCAHVQLSTVLWFCS